MPIQRIVEFDTWRPGYGSAVVEVRLAGTTTLANVYTDEAGTQSTDATITLTTQTINGVNYGKFPQPLYTDQAYELRINSIDSTGAQRPPLSGLSGEDGSDINVTVTGSSKVNALKDIVARSVDVLNYGDFLQVDAQGASSSTNTTTLSAAIAAAAANNGGLVNVPAGTYEFDLLTIPPNVILVGQEKAATILQSSRAEVVCTITGAGAGFANLTLDGVSRVQGSIGVQSIGLDSIIFDNVKIQRFEEGFQARGLKTAQWTRFDVENCARGVDLRGDLNSGQSGTGGPIRGVNWLSGIVGFCTVAGVRVEYIDDVAEFVRLGNVRFTTNSGIALDMIGARSVSAELCTWDANTTNLKIADATPAAVDNLTRGFEANRCLFDGGNIELNGTLEDVFFVSSEFQGTIAVSINTPQNNIIIRDCNEGENVTISGAPNAWLRQNTTQTGEAFGITTDNQVTKTWGRALKSGERVYLEAKVIARQRNGTREGFWHLIGGAKRPPATLLYDTQTANFTVGNILTGATSGATARIVADTDSGATGTLQLQDIDGVFVDNEIITDGSGGSATANGTQSEQAVEILGTLEVIKRLVPQADLAFDGQSGNFVVDEIVTGEVSGAQGTVDSQNDQGSTGTLTLVNVSNDFRDNETLNGSIAGVAVANGTLSSIQYQAVFAANGPEVEIQVTGENSQTIEWYVDVDVESTV